MDLCTSRVGVDFRKAVICENKYGSPTSYTFSYLDRQIILYVNCFYIDLENVSALTSKLFSAFEWLIYVVFSLQKKKLNDLGAVLTRAKGNLNGAEYDKLHQLWQRVRE